MTRRRLAPSEHPRRQLCDRIGCDGIETFAAALGITIPESRGWLEGREVSARTLLQIQRMVPALAADAASAALATWPGWRRG